MTKRLKSKGFTLIEVLGVIAILAIIVVIVFPNIGNIKETVETKRKEVTKKNVLKAAKTFSSEVDEEIWVEYENNYIYCITVRGLIHSGYFKNDEIPETGSDGELSKDTMLMMTKNADTEVVDKIAIDSNGVCKNNFSSMDLKVKSYTDTTIKVGAKCKTNKYQYTIQAHNSSTILKNSGIVGQGEYVFDNLNPGVEYKIIAQCYDSSDQPINALIEEVDQQTGRPINFISNTCTNESDDHNLRLAFDNLSSDIFKFKLKDSNASVDSKYNVKKCSSENACTSTQVITSIEKGNWYYVEKANFIGDDDYISYIDIKLQDYTDIEANAHGNNEYTGKKGQKENKEFYTSTSQRIEMLKCAEIPTSEKHCKKDLYYNSQEQELTEAPGEGYQFYDNKKKDAGTFSVPAKLNSGYIWIDGTTANKNIECKIQNRFYKINLDSGESVTTTGTTVVYEIYYDGMYINNNYSSDSKMSTTKNPITKPTKSNYTFKGYYTGTNGSGKQIITNNGYLNSTFNPTDFSSDSTLYAYWTENSYTLTYDSEGGSSCTSKTFTKGELFSKYNCTTTKSGYTFEGWYTSTGGSGTQYKNTSTMPGQDLKLYAYWKKNSSSSTTTKYTLTYDSEGGSSCTSQTFTKGELFSKYNCTTTKSGYTFEGWYTSTGGSGTQYKNTSTMPGKDLKLYANWTAVSTEPAYSDTINGERCIGNTKYYITTCQPQSTGDNAKCNYSKKNGVSSSGTVTRKSLTTCSSSSITSGYTQAKMVSGTWNIYKNPGYVNDYNKCPTSLYQYGTTGPKGCGDPSLITENSIGTIGNKTVYLKTNSSGVPTEKKTYPITSSQSKVFIKIYIKSTEFTAHPLGPLGGDESKLSSINAGSATINGTKYYAVWIAETCNKSSSTCNPTGTSLKSIKW